MALIDILKLQLVELFESDPGWIALFNHHGWTFDVAALKVTSPQQLAEHLTTWPLDVDFDLPGFEDFHSEGRLLVSPGSPAQSLLYHALASPNVVAGPDGFELVQFPSLALLDTLENFIFGTVGATLASLEKRARERLGFPSGAQIEMAICSFSVEYRTASTTVHGDYADLCFSRTGVARVGTAPAQYQPHLRGFSPFVDGDDIHSIRVLPCRYSPYIAVRSKERKDIFGPIDRLNTEIGRNDWENDFWVPLHKLFSGKECLQGLNLLVDQQSKHFNQKLEKFGHLLNEKAGGGISLEALSSAPYRLSENLAVWQSSNDFGVGLLCPVPHPLVAAAEENGAPVGFISPQMLPPGHNVLFYDSFAPSLSMVSEGSARPWPEYLHIREQVEADGTTTNLSNRSDVIDITKQGGYKALHYLDFAADGFITPVITHDTQQPLQHNGKALRVVSAYSLVSAPDFFPRVRQRFVYQWWKKEIPHKAKLKQLPAWWQWLVDNEYWKNIWRAEPAPLSDVRVAANLQMPEAPFEVDDNTISAIVSLMKTPSNTTPSIINKMPNTGRSTFLPDGAAGYFAPGWDTSFDTYKAQGTTTQHLAAYGLGSPFPEDAKLCAALSTFWPAAAPDTTRTFFEVPFSAGSVVPLTDEEMGVGTQPSWDGLVGPHITEQNANYVVVKYPDYPRADYTRNALEGKFSIAQTAKISFEEYQRRLLTMLRTYRAIGEIDTKENAHIISFTSVAAMDIELEQAQEQTNTELVGPIYRVAGFSNLFNGQENVSAPTNTDESGHYTLRQVAISWEVFVGAEAGVLMRLKQGDGSLRRSQWTLQDV
jgi:hypothetical protein